MAKIDSVYDFTDKALVELKSWLEPWFLAKPDIDTAGGGSGIMFDTDPQDGDWLLVETTGLFPSPSGTNDSMRFYSHGDIEIQNTSVDNTGNIFISGDSGVGIQGDGDEGVSIRANGAGDILIAVDTSGGGARVNIKLNHVNADYLVISGLPSSNPLGAGGNAVWRDASGFLRIG